MEFEYIHKYVSNEMLDVAFVDDTELLCGLANWIMQR